MQRQNPANPYTLSTEDHDAVYQEPLEHDQEHLQDLQQKEQRPRRVIFQEEEQEDRPRLSRSRSHGSFRRRSSDLDDSRYSAYYPPMEAPTGPYAYDPYRVKQVSRAGTRYPYYYDHDHDYDYDYDYGYDHPASSHSGPYHRRHARRAHQNMMYEDNGHYGHYPDHNDTRRGDFDDNAYIDDNGYDECDEYDEEEDMNDSEDERLRTNERLSAENANRNKNLKEAPESLLTPPAPSDTQAVEGSSPTNSSSIATPPAASTSPAKKRWYSSLLRRLSASSAPKTSKSTPAGSDERSFSADRDPNAASTAPMPMPTSTPTAPEQSNIPMPQYLDPTQGNAVPEHLQQVVRQDYIWVFRKKPSFYTAQGSPDPIWYNFDGNNQMLLSKQAEWYNMSRQDAGLTLYDANIQKNYQSPVPIQVSLHRREGVVQTPYGLEYYQVECLSAAESELRFGPQYH